MATRRGNRLHGRAAYRILLRKANPHRRGERDRWVASAHGGTFSDVVMDVQPTAADALAEDGYDGLIPASAQTTGLRVLAPKWGQITAEDLAFFLIDDVDVGDLDGIDPADYPDPMEVTIPPADLARFADGAHELRYYLFNPWTGLDRRVSLPYRMLIDTLAPGNRDLPKIDFPGVTGVVTRDEIVANGGVLTGHISAYFDMKKNDTIATFVQNATGGPVTPGPVIKVVDPLVEQHDVDFTLAQLDAANATGDVDFWYTVADHAGNTETAPKQRLTMLVSGAPDKLAPPRLPLTPDDDIVHEADARLPSSVEIPQFGHGVVGDTLFLHFESDDGTAVGPIPVDGDLVAADLPADPAVPDPAIAIRTIEVPYALLAALQPDDGTTITPVYKLHIRYEVRRGGLGKGFMSPSLDLDVDLTLAGGPDPDPETPEHDALQRPVVTDSSPTAEDNVIEDPFESPVFATIPHLTGDTPPIEVFQAGDTVALFYEDATTPETQVGVTTDATPGADLVIEIPDANVVSGTWDFFYRVGRPVSDSQTNWARSPSQRVLIKDADDIPGGGDFLPYASFREGIENAMGHLVLGDDRGPDGTMVRVYRYKNMKPGDKIDMMWKPNASPTGKEQYDLNEVALPQHEVTEQDMQPKDDRLPDEMDLPENPQVFVDFDITPAQLYDIVSTEGAPGYGSVRVTYTVTNTANDSNTSDPDRAANPHMAIDIRNNGRATHTVSRTDAGHATARRDRRNAGTRR